MPVHYPPPDLEDEDTRRIAALAVAVLGLDIIAKGMDPDPRAGAATVLRHLKERYGVTPENT